MKKRWTMLLALLLSLFMMMTSIPGIADEMVSDEWEESGDTYPTKIAEEATNASKTIDGDIVISGKDSYVKGVSVNEDEGKAIEVTVNGSVTASAETDRLDHQDVTTVEVNAAGEGSEATATVNGNISAVNRWTAGEQGNLDNAGVSVWAGEGGKAALTVNGNIFADAELYDDGDGYTWSSGAGAYNSGGDVSVIVNGDVVAESTVYGVGLNVTTETGPGQTFLQVNGDVTGKTLGIRAINQTQDCNLEIVINGTIHTSMNGISMERGSQDGVQITVWQMEPCQDGALVHEDGTVEGEDSVIEEAEKAIQYIIRIADDSAEYITTDARNYREFQVACEGETVTLQIAVPDGFKLAAVYGMPGYQMELTKDDAGNYFLIVPKGGGIELSAVLNSIPDMPLLFPTQDTARSAEQRESLQSADLSVLLPEEVLTQLPSGEMQVQEVQTMKLTPYADARHATGDFSFTLRSGKAFAAGEKATVLIALPEGDIFSWYVLEGTGRESGNLELTVSPDLVHILAGHTFYAIILE